MDFKIKDIAAELNLSPATVSLVVNRKPGISDATRNRVYKALEKHGYQEAMTQIRSGRKTLQLLIFRKKSHSAGYSRYFSRIFSGVLEGIDVQAKTLGYSLLITYADEEGFKEQVSSLLPTGLLVLGTDMHARYVKPLIKTGLPFVIIDNFYETEDINCITINNAQGVYKAIQHLCDMGHSKIGYIHSLVESYNFTERYYSYLRAMQKCELPVHSPHIFSVGMDTGHMDEELKELFLQSPSLPTAFFADNDILALHTIKALGQMGLRVPEDVSIIGFDDMPLSEMLHPALATIGISKNLMGALAVSRLDELLQNKRTQACKTETPTWLVPRESVRKIPVE